MKYIEYYLFMAVLLPVSAAAKVIDENNAAEPSSSFGSYAGIVGLLQNALLLWALLVVFISLLIYLNVRYRKEVKLSKEIRSKNINLNRDYISLKSANEEYQQTIEEYQKLLSGMTNKLKDPTNDILGKTQTNSRSSCATSITRARLSSPSLMICWIL